jgi:hypothetical protein
LQTPKRSQQPSKEVPEPVAPLERVLA